MGCNCKAASRIVNIKKRFGYEIPTNKNVKLSIKIKMILQAVLIWGILILFLPVTLVVILFSKFFKREINLFNKIKIKL